MSTITIQKLSLRLDTQKYSLEDIQKEVEENLLILIGLGCTDLINKEVKVGWGKSVRSYGTCTKIGKKANGKTLYEIKINKEYIAVAASREVHNTIMHECIHCVDGCMNHGNKWKTIAQKVNRSYDFSTIKRTGYDPAYNQILEAHYRYIAVCDRCGHAFRWMRKSHIFVSCSTGKARCSCGGTSFTCRELL